MHADDDIVRAVHHRQSNLERVIEGDVEVDDFDFSDGWHKNLLDTDYADFTDLHGIFKKKSAFVRVIRQIRVMLLFSFINRRTLF